MRKHQEGAQFSADSPTPDRRRKAGGLVLASALLLTGVAVGADQGARLIAESLQVMASDTPQKQLAQPLGPVKPIPMVSEPYKPERLKDFKPPEPVVEADREPKPAEAEVETKEAAAEAEEVQQGMASCSGGTAIERDICADPQLVALDRRIASSLPSRSDPRYQKYLEQRQHWCAPQPSQANRQECLLDLGNQLLRKL